MSTTMPPDHKRASKYSRSTLIIPKYLHADGSVTSPDSNKFTRQIYPANAERAELYDMARSVSARYLLPDGSIWDGPGLFEFESGGGGSGGDLIIVNNNHIFASDSDRDLYFTQHPGELKENLYIVVNEQLQQYRGNTWINMTPVIMGPAGYSPIIVENTENTNTVYRLDILTKDGVFTTPNLKGELSDNLDYVEETDIDIMISKLGW